MLYDSIISLYIWDLYIKSKALTFCRGIYVLTLKCYSPWTVVGFCTMMMLQIISLDCPVCRSSLGLGQYTHTVHVFGWFQTKFGNAVPLTLRYSLLYVLIKYLILGPVLFCFFLSSQNLLPTATPQDAQQWLLINRFSPYCRLFTNFSGKTAL